MPTTDFTTLYDWRVPVVLVDDRVVAEGRISGDALRKALRGQGKGPIAQFLKFRLWC